jgi:hypothetical protein
MTLVRPDKEDRTSHSKVGQPLHSARRIKGVADDRETHCSGSPFDAIRRFPRVQGMAPE